MCSVDVAETQGPDGADQIMRSHMSKTSTLDEWNKPAATAIPKEGYFTLEQGRYGPTYPRTPACHGFTIIAKIKAGTEGEIRAYGKRIEDTIAASPHALAPLQLHYLRWVLFDIGPDKYFMYKAIFETNFEKSTKNAIQLSKRLVSIPSSRSSK